MAFAVKLGLTLFVGPGGAPQGGHDWRNGSAAHGPPDVPARVLQERRLYAAFLPRGPGRAGLHSSGRSTPRVRRSKQGS